MKINISSKKDFLQNVYDCAEEEKEYCCHPHIDRDNLLDSGCLCCPPEEVEEVEVYNAQLEDEKEDYLDRDIYECNLCKELFVANEEDIEEDNIICPICGSSDCNRYFHIINRENVY